MFAAAGERTPARAVAAVAGLFASAPAAALAAVAPPTRQGRFRHLVGRWCPLHDQDWDRLGRHTAGDGVVPSWLL